MIFLANHFFLPYFFNTSGGYGRTWGGTQYGNHRHVLEYDVLEQKWTKIGETKMAVHTRDVALIHFEDYKDLCK